MKISSSLIGTTWNYFKGMKMDIVQKAINEPLFRVAHLQTMFATALGTADPFTVYREWVGHDPREDEPETDPMDCKGFLFDYIRELCAEFGINYSMICNIHDGV